MMTINSRLAAVRRREVVAAIVILGIVTGCASTGASDAPAGDGTDSPAALLVADTGVEAEPVVTLQADWGFDVNDPMVLREFSTAVVSGTVIGVERSFVDGNGGIATSYSVRVETVYKGDGVAPVISVSLPGGTVTLGEYISSLDELGLYETRLGSKAELLAGKGLPLEEDPRTLDPSLPVTENWGVNPTSESLIERLHPDSWVFFIHADDSINWGSAFDHALSYLKDGVVHSLHPEADPASIPESRLLAE